MMGRLRAWPNLPPVLQCSRYRRLLEQQHSSNQQSSNATDSSDEDEEAILGWPSTGDHRSDKKKSKRKQQQNGNSSGGGKRSRKKDRTRQLIQESFQELMSYSCGQCGHVQTLQVRRQYTCINLSFSTLWSAVCAYIICYLSKSHFFIVRF